VISKGFFSFLKITKVQYIIGINKTKKEGKDLLEKRQSLRLSTPKEIKKNGNS